MRISLNILFITDVILKTSFVYYNMSAHSSEKKRGAGSGEELEEAGMEEEEEVEEEEEELFTSFCFGVIFNLLAELAGFGALEVKLEG